jgi:hypothetical protein
MSATIDLGLDRAPPFLDARGPVPWLGRRRRTALAVLSLGLVLVVATPADQPLPPPPRPPLVHS